MTRGPDAQQQRFAQLAWHFNCHIAAMAHPSWLHNPQQAADTGWSAHLLARGGVARLHDWTLAGVARLWLLDTASLQQLQQALCGVLQRPQLVRAVSKPRREALRAQWSPATWEAANDSSAPRIKADGLAGQDNTADTTRGAARALLGLLEPSRRAVAQRARMRLPRDWRDDNPVVLPAAQRSDLIDWIARRWIPQRRTAWAWLF